MEMRLILARVFNNYKCSQAAFVDKCGQESKNFTCACTCGGMNQETQGFAGSPATRVSTCSAAVGGTVVYLYLVVPFYLHEILSDVIPIHPANVPMDLFLEIDGHKRSKLSLASRLDSSLHIHLAHENTYFSWQKKYRLSHETRHTTQERM